MSFASPAAVAEWARRAGLSVREWWPPRASDVVRRQPVDIGGWRSSWL